MNYRHRIARREDLGQIVEIYNSTVPSRMVTADTVPISVESREGWFSQHRADWRPLWVVEHDDRLIGWLSFSVFNVRPAYAATVELSVYVHQAWRGGGLGSYLLTEAIAHAPRISATTLVGLIFAHNAPSLALFERFGFARWGHLPRVAALDGVERDLIIVGRRVSPD